MIWDTLCPSVMYSWWSWFLASWRAWLIIPKLNPSSLKISSFIWYIQLINRKTGLFLFEGIQADIEYKWWIKYYSGVLMNRVRSRGVVLFQRGRNAPPLWVLGYCLLKSTFHWSSLLSYVALTIRLLAWDPWARSGEQLQKELLEKKSLEIQFKSYYSFVYMFHSTCIQFINKQILVQH